MKTSKVCLINPPTTRDQDEIFFPMGILVLATLLKQKAVPVELIDFEQLFRDRGELRQSRELYEQAAIRLFEASGANVFGISSICSNFPYALELASLIRKNWPESKIVLGGPQPSSVAEETMALFPAIDAIVVGEGENTLLELVSTDWSPESLRTTAGIVFREGDKIVRTAPRPLIEDLDELPIPDFSLLDLPKYLNPGIALIEAGRGCPFACSFCSTATFWSRKYRAKSPGRILQEMENLYLRYGLTRFGLTHDNFSTSPKYIRSFSEYFIAHNHRDFHWSSSARTDSLARCEPKKMYQAGCRNLFLGVDTGSQRLQEIIDKHLDLEEYRKILRQTIDIGIRPTTSFILGYPEETMEEVDQTLSLAIWSKGIGTDDVQVHRLAPLAGTKLYDQYHDDLVYQGVASDFSFPIAYNNDTINYIQKNPRLFSSFFAIPTPQLGEINLFLLSQFYYILLKNLGTSFAWIFKKKSPVQLYQEWNNELPKHHSKSTLGSEDILHSFLEFV